MITNVALHFLRHTYRQKQSQFALTLLSDSMRLSECWLRFSESTSDRIDSKFNVQITSCKSSFRQRPRGEWNHEKCAAYFSRKLFRISQQLYVWLGYSTRLQFQMESTLLKRLCAVFVAEWLRFQTVINY